MNAITTPLTYTHPIQIVRLDPTDLNAIQQVSQSRNAEDYDPFHINKHHFFLPPTIHRFLYDVEAMKDVHRNVQQSQLEDAHIKIIKHALTCTQTNGGPLCLAPLHVTRSFHYHGLRISGSYFVSLLHNIIATLPECYWDAAWAADLQEVRYPLSPQERQDMIEYYMYAYLQAASSCTDFTFVCIPSKPALARAKSPTHRAFTNLAVPCADNNECVIPSESTDMYVFAHNTPKENAVAHTQKLLSDPLFITKMMAFRWSPHIFEKLEVVWQAEKQRPEYIYLYDRQLFTVLEWLRVTWKNARA